MGVASDKDYFGTFLGSGAKQDEWARPEPSADLENHILRFLISEPSGIMLKELLVRLGQSPSVAISSIMKLRDANLLTIDGNDVVALTELGRKVGL